MHFTKVQISELMLRCIKLLYLYLQRKCRKPNVYTLQKYGTLTDQNSVFAITQDILL